MLAFLGLVGLLWLAQDRLIFPVRHNDEEIAPAGRWQVGEVALPAGPLRFRFADVPGPLPAVIYFHGNGGSTVMTSGFAGFLPEAGFATLAASYPGYSGNPGAPGEATIRATADALEAWARARWPGRPIAAWGESLGSFPASHLAATGRAEFLILDSPFTSLAETARHHFPWVPGLGHLLRHRMENLAPLTAARAVPTLVIVTTRDVVVPVRMGEALAAAIPGAVLQRSPVAAHPAVMFYPEAGRAAAAWLAAAATQ